MVVVVVDGGRGGGGCVVRRSMRTHRRHAMAEGQGQPYSRQGGLDPGRRQARGPLGGLSRRRQRAKGARWRTPVAPRDPREVVVV
eukprot:323519-Alexandrium_andersonii.AAC.1